MKYDMKSAMPSTTPQSTTPNVSCRTENGSVESENIEFIIENEKTQKEKR